MIRCYCFSFWKVIDNLEQRRLQGSSFSAWSDIAKRCCKKYPSRQLSYRRGSFYRRENFIETQLHWPISGNRYENSNFQQCHHGKRNRRAEVELLLFFIRLRRSNQFFKCSSIFFSGLSIVNILWNWYKKSCHSESIFLWLFRPDSAEFSIKISVFFFRCVINNCILCNGCVIEEGTELKDCLVGDHHVVAADGRHNQEVLTDADRLMEIWFF